MKSLWEPRYDDPRDQRVVEILREFAESWQPSIEQLPLKDLRNKLIQPRDLAPEMLDRSYVETAEDGMLLEMGSGTFAMGNTSGGVGVVTISFDTVPEYFDLNAWPASTWSGFYKAGASIGTSPPTGSGLYHNTTSAQTITYNWICIRPRS